MGTCKNSSKLSMKGKKYPNCVRKYDLKQTIFEPRRKYHMIYKYLAESGSNANDTANLSKVLNFKHFSTNLCFRDLSCHLSTCKLLKNTTDTYNW